MTLLKAGNGQSHQRCWRWLYCQRNCIERVLGHLKINRAVATRYDQLADSFRMLYLATARYWIKFVHAA